MKFWLLAILFLCGISTYAEVDQDIPSDSEQFNNGTQNPGNQNSDYATDIGMLTPTLSGNGCPNGTGRATLSPDKKSVSILFDQFIAQSGGNTNLQKDRKNCQIKIPFKVPAGYRVLITGIDYRGYNMVSAGTRSVLRTIYQITSPNGQLYGRRFARHIVFQGPIDSDFAVSTRTPNTSHITKCGVNFNLNIDTIIKAVSGPQMAQVYSSLDSIDAGNSQMTYYLKWERCGNGPTPPTPPPTPTPTPNPLPTPTPTPTPQPNYASCNFNGMNYNHGVSWYTESSNTTSGSCGNFLNTNLNAVQTCSTRTSYACNNGVVINQGTSSPMCTSSKNQCSCIPQYLLCLQIAKSHFSEFEEALCLNGWNICLQQNMP